MAMPSISTADDLTPPVNRYLLLRDVELGTEAAEGLQKQVSFLADEAVQRYINELGRRLIDNMPENLRQPAFAFSFEVLDRPDLAAFALPGGPVFVSRGVIAATASEDELAGLLAHLASHVVLRHATAQASAADDHLPGPVSGRIIVAAARSGGGVLAEASNFAVASYFLTYSPEHERQADLAAMRTLERAGYDAAAVAAMRRTIAAAGAEQDGAQWVLGHPNTAPARGSGGSATRAAASRGERPRLASDSFLAIQRRLGELPISRTDSMTVYRPRIAGAAYGIAVPSGEYRRETVGGRLALNVPANWRRLVMGTAVAFEPDGASQALRGGVSLTHGVQIGVARSLAGDLQRDLEALLQHLGRANSQVRWTPAFQRTQIGERRAALTTSFTSVSALTGEFEQAWITAAHLPGGTFLYVVGVAPRDQSAVYGGAFERIVASIREDR
jgi:hypothetical protein